MNKSQYSFHYHTNFILNSHWRNTIYFHWTRSVCELTYLLFSSSEDRAIAVKMSVRSPNISEYYVFCDVVHRVEDLYVRCIQWIIIVKGSWCVCGVHQGFRSLFVRVSGFLWQGFPSSLDGGRTNRSRHSKVVVRLAWFEFIVQTLDTNPLTSCNSWFSKKKELNNDWKRKR